MLANADGTATSRDSDTHVTASKLSERDEGKTVVNADGAEVGIVAAFRGGTAFVDPDPDIADSVKPKLGWGDVDADQFPLNEDHVETVTDDEVRLNRL